MVSSGKEEMDENYKNDPEDYIESSSVNCRTSASLRESEVYTCENEENMDSEPIIAKSHNVRKRAKLSSKISSDETQPQKRMHILNSRSQNGSSDEKTISPSLDNGLDELDERKIPPDSKDSNMDECQSYSTSEDPLQDMKCSVASPDDIKEDRKEGESAHETSHTLGFNDDAVCEHGMVISGIF